MRWLFYLLLAGNAALLGWGLRQLEPQAAVAPERPLPTTVNRLLLLSELEDGALRERRADPGPEAVPETPPAAEVAAETPAPVVPPPPAATGSGDAFATLAQAVDAATRGYAPPAPPVPQPVARLCYSIGPLENAGEVDRMREWLVGQGGEPRLREDERREVALYWVHFPPLPDRASAVDRVERMRAEGVEDIFIIPGGDMRNAISLGVYARPESMERRLRELRGKGYDPSVVNRYRTSVAAWFDVSLPGDFEFDGEQFAARFPTAQMEPVGCERVQDGDAPAG